MVVKVDKSKDFIKSGKVLITEYPKPKKKQWNSEKHLQKLKIGIKQKQGGFKINLTWLITKCSVLHLQRDLL